MLPDELDDMIEKDSLSLYVKKLEDATTAQKADASNAIVVRCDGRGFSSWTKNLNGPFDPRLKDVMVYVTKKLAEEFSAKIAYTASDEITIVMFHYGDNTEHYAGGRFQKIVSHAASIATAHFNAIVPSLIPEKAGNMAMFDARAWECSIKDTFSCLMARENSAIRNSVFMQARSVFSHKKIQGMGRQKLKILLQESGHSWDDIPDWAKRGIFIKKVSEELSLTEEELEKLPPKHNARLTPDFKFWRNEYKEVALPSISENKPLAQAKLYPFIIVGS